MGFAPENQVRTGLTSVRLMRIPAICLAPQYVAEELLRAEGFSGRLNKAVSQESLTNIRKRRKTFETLKFGVNL